MSREKKPTARGARAGNASGAGKASGPGEASTPPGELLAELIEISRAVGGDANLVQGGGGNTSVKSAIGDRLLVKASGAPLAEVSAERGWAELDLVATRSILDETRLASLETTLRESAVRQRLAEAVVGGAPGARPSVESSLHALLDRVVVHTHPVALNAFLSTERSRESWSKLLGDLTKSALYVEYVDPGHQLAVEVRKRVDAFREANGRLPSIVLLENHGLFVGAETTKHALELTRDVVSRAEAWAKLETLPSGFAWVETAVEDGGEEATRVTALRGALLRAGAHAPCVRRDRSDLARRFAKLADAVELAKGGAFTPDHIIYCGTHVLALDGARPASWEAAARKHREKHGVDPRVILVDRDVYHAAEDLAQLRVVAEMYRAALATFVVAKKGGGPRYLSKSATRFVESWNVDTFRSRLAASGGRPLSGRVAFVTGAASGLGKGISLGLIEAGATVFAGDVDRDGLAEVAASLPEGRYLPLFCDVTSEASVDGCFASVVASAGGLDHVVNAAGIAPAFPLVDFPLGAWQKTLEINLTGYFLVARAAARVMLAQGAGGGIVNLTSKSGLEASKANSAYNATKAGEVHLMRGWALELGAAGIRVNCVAPGNVFKGSKIWNDEYIRMAAKKKGIRPEEVIPYYTSLSPLGQEIEPCDIAGAVVWLLSDDSRRVTGQTLVVDGGQVMVR